MLAAQDWIAALLTADGADDATAQNTLSDLGIVASWVLRQAPAGQFAGSARMPWPPGAHGPGSYPLPAASPAGSRPPAPR